MSELELTNKMCGGECCSSSNARLDGFALGVFDYEFAVEDFGF